MKAAFLTDGGVVKVTGDDARHFLNNLVTADLDEVKPGTAKFGALLTPQGKIVADFLIAEAPQADGGGLLLDCSGALAASLATKLNFYKLRAKVTVDNLSDQTRVLAIWDGSPGAVPGVSFADPRHPALGRRYLLPAARADEVAAQLGAAMADVGDYEAHRIACGVPRGGVDFAYGDAFPHEANMDRLAGVDFDKGCYIGQEVVSRMQHRGTARTRIVRVAVDGFGPEPGLDVVADDRAVGTMGSSAAGKGLATLRIDKVADALAAGRQLSAGGVPLTLVDEGEIAVQAKQGGV